MIKFDFELNKLEERKEANEALIEQARQKLKKLSGLWAETEERILNEKLLS